MENVKKVTEEEIRQAQRDYMKAYRAKNKDKFKNYQKTWYAKRAAAKKETGEEIAQKEVTKATNKIKIDDAKLFS